MDATRTKVDYLIKVYQEVEKAGADMINVPDTVGIMRPSAMKDFVKKIYDTVKIPIDVHCHNDFGLAVANSLAAVEAGARQVQVAVNSLGERAGNADLAETVMSLHSITTSSNLGFGGAFLALISSNSFTLFGFLVVTIQRSGCSSASAIRSWLSTNTQDPCWHFNLPRR